MKKNFKLAFLFDLFTKHEGDDVVGSDEYIDLFYSATQNASKEDLIEVIYQLINSKVYDTDWEDVIDELDDCGIFEKIETADEFDDDYEDFDDEEGDE